MTKPVLFIRGGGGEDAYKADGLLVASLQNALGTAYEVHYPKMRLRIAPSMRIGKLKLQRSCLP